MGVVGFGPGEANVPQSDSGLRVHHVAEERLDVLVLSLDGTFFKQGSSGGVQRNGGWTMFVECVGRLRKSTSPIWHLLLVMPNCVLSWFDSNGYVVLRGLLF